MEKIFESEYRFLSILWENEPIASPELVRLCNEQLGWKKSTTYTVIKKLTDKGIVKSENTVVSALVAKDEVDKWQSEELLQRTSKGNIPLFLAAFLKDRKLSRADLDRIRQIIGEAEEEK
ncbi:MAG: BlaI/MecI/CopY family transcriptional regulator [Lachnospiraceae bacterium]|nr:BlaI/MecI/CopY family transcriptional regulator [Lachnospiraceae bacterium]